MPLRGFSLLFWLTLTGAAAGCAAPRTEIAPAADPVLLPASFEGELPCADCPGILYHLDLEAGGEFLLRTTYRDRPPVPDTIGVWTRTDDQRTLILDTGGERTERFAIGANGTLAKLDLNGRPIESSLNFELARLPSYAPVPPTPLDATTWHLTHLGSRRVVRPLEARAVTLVFNGDAARVTGSTGCNAFTGTVTRHDAALTFGPLAATKMFCADSADVETSVLSALTMTNSYRIVGGVLELRDASGARLALYAAR